MAAGSTSDTSSNDGRKGDSGYGIGRISAILTGLVSDLSRDILAILSSSKVQKGILYTIVVAVTSAVLYVPAVLAYILFYNNYLPDQITTVPVHLQYGYGANPWGVASISHTKLKNTQPYDISVSLTLPKSPTNLERGNFMVALHLIDDMPPRKKQKELDSPLPPQPTSSYTTGPHGQPLLPVQRDPTFYFAGKDVVFTSTRPALLPYTDPLVSLASRVFFIAYHVLKPHSEYTTMRVNLAENLAFPRGAVLPTSVFVEVQAGQSLQVHRASATFAAQLAGLRYFMYYWRVTAFVGFTAAFWVCEVGFMVVTWGLASLLFQGGEGKSGSGGAVVKVEGGEETVIKRDNDNDDGLSDTERTFPSTSRQPPIKFEGRIKQEEGEAQGVAPDVYPAVEADDEDDGELEDDAPAYRDSGIGTSYDDNVSREGVKRRTSGGRSGRG